MLWRQTQIARAWFDEKDDELGKTSGFGNKHAD
jgi:hypothetical protein